MADNVHVVTSETRNTPQSMTDASQLAGGANAGPNDAAPSGASTLKDAAGTTSADAWYTKSVQDVVQELGTDGHRGLASEDAKQRLQKYGVNELNSGKGVTWPRILLHNLINLMNVILALAVVLSAVVGNYVEAGIVLLIIILNTGIGFVQEFRSGKTLEALRSMSSPTAILVRDGDTDVYQCREVVPGDLVSIMEGNVIPADLRLVSAINLEVNEMMLTGEAMPVQKSEAALTQAPIPVGDRHNMAFKNSLVTRGRGMGIAVGTGMRTEIGAIARSVADDGEMSQKTPLQRKLDQMMLWVFASAVGLAIIVFAANRFQWSEVVALYAISVAVAMIPEGLPAVTTVTMAIGVRRMAKQKAIVRRLSALEALGQVSHICSDKTGTLTEGKMVVTSAWVAQRTFEVSGLGIVPEGTVTFEQGPISREMALAEAPLRLFLYVCALCTSSTLYFDADAQQWKSSGDPTEVALMVLAEKLGVNADALQFSLVAELPFDMVLKRMSTIVRDAQRRTVHVLAKGAVESVLECCVDYICEDGTTAAVSEEFLQLVQERNVELAEQGMRVLALAHRGDSYVEEGSEEELDAAAREGSSLQYGLHARAANESGLTFLGLAAIHDPPRAESKAAIRMCHIAGIHVHMATGDHRLTAESIARRIGILAPSSSSELVMSAAEFEAEIERRAEARRIDEELAAARRRRRTMADAASVLSAASKRAKDSIVRSVRRLSSGGEEAGTLVNADGPASSRASIRSGNSGRSNGTSPARVRVAGADGQIADTLVDTTDLNMPGPHAPFGGSDAGDDDDDEYSMFPPLVLARCSPESKVKLIEELHRRKKFVAMTGDGVNDAPAVKRSDIGIAMGLAGSDVTKQVSDLTLTDDNFATIVKAIAEGRRIFANTAKLTVHLLSSNVAEVIVLVLALAIRDGEGNAVFPMSPIQILYLNMLTSTPIALALGCEPPSEDIMRLPPRSRDARLFSRPVLADIFAYGVVGGALSLTCYIVSVVVDVGAFSNTAKCSSSGHGGDFSYGTNCQQLAAASATAFYSLSYILMWHGLNCRHSQKSAFRMRLTSNKLMLYALVFGVVLTTPTAYIPVINNFVFNQAPITWQWALIIPALIAFILFSEAYKWLLRRKFPPPTHYGTPIGLDIRNRRILSLPTNYADVVPITQD